MAVGRIAIEIAKRITTPYPKGSGPINAYSKARRSSQAEQLGGELMAKKRKDETEPNPAAPGTEAEDKTPAKDLPPGGGKNGRGRRRGGRGRGGKGKGRASSAPSQSPIDAFIANHTAQSRGYFAEISGDKDVQSFTLNSLPNVYMALVWGGGVVHSGLVTTDDDDPSTYRGGYTNEAQNANSVDVSPSETEVATWYHPTLENRIWAEILLRMRANVRGTFRHSITDVREYFCSMANILAKYYAITSWLSIVEKDWRPLSEVNQGVRALYPYPFGRDLAEGAPGDENSFHFRLNELKAQFSQLDRTMSSLYFPPMWKEIIKRLYGVKKLGPKPDDPIGGYMPVDLPAVCQRANDPDGGHIRELIQSPVDFVTLQEDVDHIIFNTNLMKFIADLSTTFGDAWGLSMGDGWSCGEMDAQWLETWKNGAYASWLLESSNHTGRIVPNARNDDESKRYMLNYEFEAPPDAFNVITMPFGLGNELSDIRGRHLLNVHPLMLVNEGTAVYGTEHPKMGIWYYGGEPDAQAQRNFVSDATEDVLPVAANLHRRANLGWKMKTQRDAGTHLLLGKTDTNDSFKGFVPTNPFTGERKWVEPFFLEDNAYSIMRAFFGI